MEIHRYREETEGRYFFRPHSKLFAYLHKNCPSDFKSRGKTYSYSNVLTTLIDIIWVNDLNCSSNEDFIVPDREFKKVCPFEVIPVHFLHIIVSQELIKTGKENLFSFANVQWPLSHVNSVVLFLPWHKGNIRYKQAVQKGKLLESQISVDTFKLLPFRILRTLGLSIRAHPVCILVSCLINMIKREIPVLLKEFPSGIGVLHLKDHILESFIGFEIILEEDAVPLVYASLGL